MLTLGGLVAAEDTGHVLRPDSSPIDGLFAVGRCAVGICSHSYVSGLSLADCVFSGRRAGKHAYDRAGRAADQRPERQMGMDPKRQPSALRTSVAAWHSDSGEGDAAAAVTALFAVNALGLAKLAYVMTVTALRRLPHRQREVLVLRSYLDMTEQEIAAQMGIGPSTVRSSAHRGLAALGRIIKEMS